MTEAEALAAANNALNAIDAATTTAGESVSSIQARIDELLGQISNNPDSSAEITALAERAQATSANLGGIADALKAMGKVEEPVPVPVPEPQS